ncbi:MAG: matrixin family metalloprotease [Acidobacteria bacterium]|nr:matrixin family metalloprotease [Acidobacteriota bacterium]
MQHTSLALVAACVFSLFCANGEELRLKTRVIDPALEATAAFKLRAAGANPRSVSGRRWHWLVQFDNANPDLKAWEDRGAKILASVPVNGFIISVPDSMSWNDLPLVYRSPLDAGDKMSPQVLSADLMAEGQSQRLVIVHFHKDVEAWEADAILEAEGVALLKNGSLEAEDRLAEITIEQMSALTLWDEVEYVFPAPQGMKTGEMYLGCGGVISGGYEVAMLAASFGEGWDGPGRGRASISYSFGNLGSRVDPAQTQAEARRAMAEWSKAVAVTFTETTARNASRNIDILFATGDHGDPFPFRSGSTVLGHSFYPANPNPEPLAGDIHINDAWGWSIGGQWDVFSVILH